MTVVIGVAIPEDVAEIIKNIAKERYCSKSSVIREFLVKGLKSEGLIK